MKDVSSRFSCPFRSPSKILKQTKVKNDEFPSLIVKYQGAGEKILSTPSNASWYLVKKGWLVLEKESRGLRTRRKRRENDGHKDAIAVC